jgi:hypothetical protein
LPRSKGCNQRHVETVGNSFQTIVNSNTCHEFAPTYIAEKEV